MVDIIGITEAVHNVKEVREASDDITNSDIRCCTILFSTNDMADFLFSIVVINFDEIDHTMVI